MKMPLHANIAVVAVKSLPGGEREAERMMKSLPGSQLGRCNRCQTKVLLAPSTIEQLKNNAGHRAVCYQCMAAGPAPRAIAVTAKAVEDLRVMDENEKGN